MSSILNTYYNGVLKQLRAEIDLLNGIIPHNVTKGTQNEEALKNVIRNFIPKKYSVGSGIIIDSYGNASRQVDIVIYNSDLYPSLFGHATTAIFPVEVVLATIEVKTYLNQDGLELVIENTKSIKKLKHYVEKITINKPDPEFPLRITGYKTNPPICFTVAFRTDSSNPLTWKKRLLSEENRHEHLPEATLLLDNGFVYRFNELYLKNDTTFQAMFFQLRALDIGQEGHNNVVFLDAPNSTVIHNGTAYSSGSFKQPSGYPVFMPERAFLTFLMSVGKILDKIPQHLTFDGTKYLDPNYGHGLLV